MKSYSSRDYKVYLDGHKVEEYNLKVFPHMTFSNGMQITQNRYILNGEEVYIDVFADKNTIRFVSVPPKA